LGVVVVHYNLKMMMMLEQLRVFSEPAILNSSNAWNGMDPI
jgi:hypothetical protein